MANSYFQFKQFTIRQDNAAMKVCTDACLFGAWVGNRFNNQHKLPEPVAILDIGTGTGLLSLMLSQKIDAQVDAVEIDPKAAAQARENVAQSAWSDKVQVVEGDVKQHQFARKYELIISNPPFYENDLRSGDASKDRAKHDTGLTMQQLVVFVSQHLTSTGSFAVLLPYHRMEYFMEAALAYHLKTVERLLVKPTPKHPFTRAMLLLSKDVGDAALITEELIIKEVHHSYSPKFVYYLEDYYLSL